MSDSTRIPYAACVSAEAFAAFLKLNYGLTPGGVAVEYGMGLADEVAAGANTAVTRIDYVR